MIDMVVYGTSLLLVVMGLVEGAIYFLKWLDLHSKVGKAFFLGTPFLLAYIISSIVLLGGAILFRSQFFIGLFSILCLFLVFPAFIELSRLWLVTKDNVDRYLNYTPKGKKAFIV